MISIVVARVFQDGVELRLMDSFRHCVRVFFIACGEDDAQPPVWCLWQGFGTLDELQAGIRKV